MFQQGVVASKNQDKVQPFHASQSRQPSFLASLTPSFLSTPIHLNDKHLESVCRRCCQQQSCLSLSEVTEVVAGKGGWRIQVGSLGLQVAGVNSH
ncbi:hypothetical protein DPX16_10030 [Anabarilius grahami]|uniref:Uncharacterized protein n=1 Tax=Anabarilius grahami TaxID=495550 RepID=A0A3N0XYM1_ANAGA|nr:hypothetical protein DPX16_10030 [Anabarilius grahami]